jgi:hypothetical protein
VGVDGADVDWNLRHVQTHRLKHRRTPHD